MTETTGSPGSISDRRNWKPADNATDYLRNCEVGLEIYSQRRMAKLLGVSRVMLWRWKSMAAIPENLFDRLMKISDHTPSTKELAEVGRALHGKGKAELERCPNCGWVLRVRARWRKETQQAVNEWLSEQER